MNNTTTETILHTWGEGQRRLPDHAPQFKATLFERFPAKLNKPLSPPSRHLKWLSLSSGVLAVVVYVVLSVAAPAAIEVSLSTAQLVAPSSMAPTSEVDSMDRVASSQAFSGSAAKSQGVGEDSVVSFAPPFQALTPPIAGTREFLKTSYSASVRIRHVESVGERLETSVRGLGGRIDGVTLDRESGNIAFALPQEKLDAFRTELRQMVGDERFITSRIQTENKLPEKQSLEAQRTDAQSSLETLQSQAKEIETAHAKVVASLQSQLTANRAEQKSILAQERLHPENVPALEARLQALRQAEAVLQGKLNQEQSAYAAQSGVLKAQIDTVTARAQSIDSQDIDLLNNVETVHGSITLSRMSWVAFADAYIYFRYTIPFSLLLVAVVSMIWYRRQTRLPLV